MLMMRRLRLLTLAGLAATLSCTTSVAVELPEIDLSLEVVSGATPLTQAVNTLAATVPSVRVTDGAGAPVAGLRVLFLVTRGGGGVGSGDVTTDANGVASPGSWRYGTRAGPQGLAAAVVGATADARASFSGTAIPGPTTTVAVTPSAVALRPGFTRQLSASSSDAFGNPTPGGPAPAFVSLDAAVATVSGTGLITAVSPGATTVRVTIGATVVGVPVIVGSRPTGSDVVASVVGDEPYAVAVRNDGLVYVARGLSLSLARYQLPSTASLGNIATGSGRTADVAFVNGQELAYTANIDIAAVSIISTTTHTLLRTVSAGGEVLRVRSSPAGDYVFFTTVGGELKRINTVNDQISSISLGGTLNGLAVNAARGVLYVTSTGGTLYEVSLANFTMTRQVSLGGVAQGIAVSPNGDILFVAIETAGARSLDATTLAVGPAFGPTAAFDVAITTDGAEVYITSPSASTVAVHDATSRAFIRSHALAAARRVAFSADGSTAIVAGGGGSVLFIR